LLLFEIVLSTFGEWTRRTFGIEMGLGMTTIVIAHITFCLSYVTMVVLGRLQEFDRSVIEAAQDLGASGLYTFFRVT
ncbi:MAG: ABC transporter permease subunit, partial [Kiritimatiellae bacterium]|nr:ABC transporter permease subunit [Kiritimatiellia bacterium]